MTETFQYYDKTITLSTAATAAGIDWWVEVPQDDGTVMRYILTYPTVEAGAIRVSYTPQRWFAVGSNPKRHIETLPTQGYYEPNLMAFYNAVVGEQTYGEFAAQQAINGLVARLPELGGDPQNPLKGHRVYTAGRLMQPVIFELVDVVEESAASAADGGFRVQIVNGIAPYKWRLSTDSQWRTVTEVYDDLSEGEYTVEVEDDAGDTRSEKVYVPLAEPANV